VPVNITFVAAEKA